MKIQLSQDEIEQAVRDYVSKGITLANGNQMTVDFSMGRGDNGLSATIDIPYMGVASLPVTPNTTAAAPTKAFPVTAVAASDVVADVAAAAAADPAPAFAEPNEAGTDAAAPAAATGRSLFASTPAT